MGNDKTDLVQVSGEHNPLSIGISCSLFEGDHVANVIDAHLIYMWGHQGDH